MYIYGAYFVLQLLKNDSIIIAKLSFASLAFK